DIFDMAEDNTDVAFFFGHGVWPDAECLPLMGETVVPVCSPKVLDNMDIKSPLDLTKLVLLRINTRPEAWHDWFEAQGIQTGSSYHGPRFDTFSMALEAARARCGVALVPRFLAVEELENGELTIPWPFVQRSRGAYYLAYPEHKRELHRVKVFVDWIKAQIATIDPMLSEEQEKKEC